MDKIRSLYLECLRVSAAMYVFIYHIGSGKLGETLYFSTIQFNQDLGLTNHSAHYFVIVFFVLSGYLISMSACKAGVTFKSFLIARLGRLYSVLIPALIFSYLVAIFLDKSNLVPAQAIENYDNLSIRFLLNIFFLTQTWTLCSTPPLNTPFWSVNYEFIYYIFIAATLLITKNRIKFILLSFLIIISWPKVMLLFPSWLAGALLYFFSNKINIINKKVSTTLFLISFGMILSIIKNPFLMPFIKDVSENSLYNFPLIFSWNYQADFLFSLLVASNIYFLFSISGLVLKFIPKNILEITYTFVRKIGNCSYTLYLFHVPLLFFFTSILPYEKENYYHQFGMFILVLVSVYLIARQTEWKVEFWRSLVERVFEFVFKLGKALNISYK